MTNLNGNDPNRILNQCRDIDRGIDSIESDLQRLKSLQDRFVDDVDGSKESPLRKELDRLSAETMNKYKSIGARVKAVKQDPQSGNPRNAPQVGKVDRRLKTVINKCQQNDRDYRNKLQERMAREYRIVRPDASDAEVREAVEDPNNTQVFSQAVRM